MKLHANAKLTPASRLLLCRRIQEEGRSLAEAAEAAGVSERTARKWLARYRTEGAPGLTDRSSRPQRIPRRTAPDRARAVIGLRRAGMAPAERRALQDAYRVLYRSGLAPARAVARIREEPPMTAPVRTLLDFIESAHRLGIVGAPRDGAGAADEETC